jgi:hypothetical protein
MSIQPYYGGNQPYSNPYSAANAKDAYYDNEGQYVQVSNPAYRYDKYGREGYNYGPIKQQNTCAEDCLACVAATCCCCLMCDVLT